MSGKGADPAAPLDLAALIGRWRGPLVGLLAARGLPWPRAEELAQDTFAEAWLGRERFAGELDDERAVGAWLAGIARNLHRAEARESRRSARIAAVEASSAPASNADPAASLDTDAESARVHAAIDALPQREREVVRAFYLEETSTARVAALLETSERAVEGLLRRARGHLRAALGRPSAG